MCTENKNTWGSQENRNYGLTPTVKPQVEKCALNFLKPKRKGREKTCEKIQVLRRHEGEIKNTV